MLAQPQLSFANRATAPLPRPTDRAARTRTLHHCLESAFAGAVQTFGQAVGHEPRSRGPGIVDGAADEVRAGAYVLEDVFVIGAHRLH